MSREEETILRLHEIALRDVIRMRREFPEHEEELSTIRFEWNRNMTRSAGNARHNGLVRLSIKIWAAPENNTLNLEDDFLNTVRHEVAHVLAGCEIHGHDHVWYATARKLGCDGERYHELIVPAAHTRKRNNPWPCARCRQTVLLGPGQFRRAKYEGVLYTHHPTCPNQERIER